ncbi:hypothetical protein D3C74_494130 [compost metagenome]
MGSVTPVTISPSVPWLTAGTEVGAGTAVGDGAAEGWELLESAGLSIAPPLK